MTAGMSFDIEKLLGPYGTEEPGNGYYGGESRGTRPSCPPCPDGSERRDLARRPMGSPPNARLFHCSAPRN
jgi:hypothetical protein